MKYSIIIPVFNSDKSLEELVQRIAAAMKGVEYEIIFIDDSSENPATWKTLKQLSKTPEVKAIQLMRNFGKAGAVLAGFEVSTGDYIITMDDDLQHAPEDIPLLM